VLTVPADVVEKSAYPAVLDPTIGPEIGTDNPIFAAAGGDQTRPAVAFGNGNYLVGWDRSRGANVDLYGVRVSPGGAVLDPTGIPITTGLGDQLRPAIAFDGTNWIVTWDGTPANPISVDIYAARVSPAGVVLDPGGIQVTNTGIAYGAA